MHHERDDRNHERATRFLHEGPQTRLLLADLVVAESGTRLRARSSAAHAVGRFLESRRHELVFALSMADCTGVAIMQRLHVAEAFTFDRDFRDCGFGMAPS